MTLFLSTFAHARRSHPKSQSLPFYTNSKHIMELTASTFNDYVFSSNYTTIVEFYAPWCGYCQKLKPDYEAASKEGHHYAQFAAINCDDKQNRDFCQSQGITGFPTLKTYRPPKTFINSRRRNQQYAVQSYENERSKTGILNAMKGQVKGYTKKITSKNIDKLLKSHKEISSYPKVLYFTDDSQISAMYKSLAIDFMGSLELFHGITHGSSYLETTKKHFPQNAEILENLTTPAILVLDPESDDIIVYEGELKKNSIAKFLTQFGTPVEGEYSERNQIIKGIKDGKYKSFRDYNKKKAKAQKAEKNAKQDALKKDEL